MSRIRIEVDAEGVCQRPLDLIMSDLSAQYGVHNIRPDDCFGADATEQEGTTLRVKLWRYSATSLWRNGDFRRVGVSAWHPAEKKPKDGGKMAVTLLRKMLHDDVGWFTSAIELDHPCGLDGVTLRKEAVAAVRAWDNSK